jgi:very-short-patch-repair endonuclease
MDPREAEYLRLAATQCGLITRAQLLMLGLTATMIDKRIRTGRLIVLHPTVYAVPGVPTSWEQRILAACFWAGPVCAASHRAAGVIWRFDAVPAGFVEIATTRQLRCKDVTVHQCRSLSSNEIMRRRGIPITDPTRTLLDLSSVLPLKALEAAFESALRKRLTYVDLLQERFSAWARQGRTGASKWRQLLELRDPGVAPTASYLETLMVQLGRDFNLGIPERQYVVRDYHGKFVGRLDFAYPDLRFGIETNGADPHLALEPWENDQARGNRFVAVDWRVLNFPWRRIVNDRAGVAAEVIEVVELLTGQKGR